MPTLAAVLLIVSGERRFGPGLLLAVPPLRAVGRISYSLYLWHWPILALPAIAREARSASKGASSWRSARSPSPALSWRFVEEPFHRGRFATSAPRRVIQVGLAAIIAVVVVVAGGMAVGSLRIIDEISGAAARPSPTPTVAVPTASPSVATPSPSATGAAPSPAATATPTPTASPEPTPPPLTWDQIPDLALAEPLPLPADVRPSLANARKDTEALYRDGCAAQVSVIKPPDCVYGDPAGAFTVALVGDSHAGQWFPAFEALAAQRGWRLLPFVKLSCPFIDMPVSTSRSSVSTRNAPISTTRRSRGSRRSSRT